MTETPKRGRPPLPEAERKRRATVRDRAKQDRRRADRVSRSLLLTPVQAERLERLMTRGGYATAAALVTALITAAPEPTVHEIV